MNVFLLKYNVFIVSAAGLTIMLAYIFGVYIGKRYARRELVSLFQSIISEIRRMILTGDERHLKEFIEVLTENNASFEKTATLSGTIDHADPDEKTHVVHVRPPPPKAG